MANDNMEGPSPRELYELTRSKYTHEDIWTQQRIGWLLTANGFLFAGYGAILGFSSTGSEVPAERASVLILSLLLISVVGVFLALFAGAGVCAAYLSKKSAIKEWNSLVEEKYRLLFPKIEATTRLKWLGSFASGGLCVFLFFAWISILALTLFRLNDKTLMDLLFLKPQGAGMKGAAVSYHRQNERAKHGPT